MNPQYAIVSQETKTMDGVTGTLYEVILRASNGVEEAQSYFVADSESVDDVLTTAATNMDDELKARETVILEPVENEVPIFIDVVTKKEMPAEPMEKLPRKLVEPMEVVA